ALDPARAGGAGPAGRARFAGHPGSFAAARRAGGAFVSVGAGFAVFTGRARGARGSADAVGAGRAFGTFRAPFALRAGRAVFAATRGGALCTRFAYHAFFAFFAGRAGRTGRAGRAVARAGSRGTGRPLGAGFTADVFFLYFGEEGSYGLFERRRAFD